MNLGVRQQLDYELYTNEERSAQVRELFTKEISSLAAGTMEQPSTQAELELCANFILYGKDEDGKNFCQKKEIQIDPAHSAYKKKEDISLDALCEEEGFKEEKLKPIKKNIYKVEKEKIDREKDKDIPGLKDLWAVIDALAEKVKVCKETKTLRLEFYQNNHLLIELRKEQYAVKDAAKEGPTFKLYSSPAPLPLNLYSDTGYAVDWHDELEYNTFLLNKMRREGYTEEALQEIRDLIANDQKHIDEGEDWTWVEISENAIDLNNPPHVYAVLELYGALREDSYEELDADSKFLLFDLERAIDKTYLRRQRRDILIRKIDKATNNVIADEVAEKYGMDYSPNYISTIYKQMICKSVADTHKLLDDFWRWRNIPEKFKYCRTCGRKLLKDPRCFVRSSIAFDGLKLQCKECGRKFKNKGE